MSQEDINNIIKIVKIAKIMSNLVLKSNKIYNNIKYDELYLEFKYLMIIYDN